jgi:hypothetical protein
MSRDVYMYAEKRVAEAWELAEEPELYVHTVFGLETGEQWYEPQTCYFESGRRSFFDVLVKPEWYPDPVKSFGEPRGLPPDMSPILRAHAERRMDWSFYHSWLSLAELLAFDWMETHVEDAREFADTVLPALREFGAPEDVRVVFWFS